MRRSLFAVCAGLVWLACAPGADAAIHVSIGDLSLLPAQVGYVDVMISSDAGTDWLDIFGLEFRITTSSGRRLEFVDPQSDPQLVDPAYLLFGNSAAASVLPPLPSALIITTFKANDTYIGGDGTVSGLGVLVPSAPALLARLQVTAATSNAPLVGDQFTVSLEPGPFTFFNGPTDEYQHYLTIGYGSSDGTVSMLVPEPSTLVLWTALGLPGLVIASRRRTRGPLSARPDSRPARSTLSSAISGTRARTMPSWINWP